MGYGQGWLTVTLTVCDAVSPPTPVSVRRTLCAALQGAGRLQQVRVKVRVRSGID